MFLTNNSISAQQLLGLQTFGKYGLVTANKREIVFFSVLPSNIAVMSRDTVERKINNLMLLLSAWSDIEIICTDGCESFDQNKIFITDRIAQEENPKVQELLKLDLEHMDSIQSEMANARQFFFAYKFNKARQSDDEIGVLVTRIERQLAEQDFVSHRLEKPAIKKLLAVYFGISSYGDSIPDEETYNGEDAFL
ncbi:MAG: hypothetical protein J1E39_03680 [Eubacterium sp.]|nr:hypothetical protein [Eubacterium sp.]